jgi:hypothetical protein
MKASVNSKENEDNEMLDLLISLRLIEDDLVLKKERFVSYLKMEQSGLNDTREYVDFLVWTTNDLLERSATLNKIIKVLIASNIRQKNNMQQILEKIVLLKSRVEAGASIE